MNDVKIRTVAMNERGVIVIPEETRHDLKLSGKTTLVLIQKGSEIVLKKEDDVARMLASGEEEDWKRLSEASMRRAWGKEDDVWDEVAKKMKVK